MPQGTNVRGGWFRPEPNGRAERCGDESAPDIVQGRRDYVRDYMSADFPPETRSLGPPGALRSAPLSRHGHLLVRPPWEDTIDLDRALAEEHVPSVARRGRRP
jgi:hypothetical protein